MSFSMEVKEELALAFPAARHCQIAELLALTLACGSLVRQKDTFRLIFFSENESVLRKCFTFLQKAFNIEAIWVEHRNNQVLEVSGEQSVDRILQALKLEKAEGSFDTVSADGRITAKPCCRRAFIRGCFLASGSVTAPQKSYHYEIISPSAVRAGQIQQLICSFGVDAKTVVRKKYFVVYVKEGDQIANMLSLMEAPKALMAFENVRILKDVRNGVNRRVNCEAANISKTASAAYEQTEAIHYISKHYGLENLPDHLREVALLRLEKQDASLTELGRLLDPPVGKSGVNHRLRKLKAIADQMREGGRL